MIKLGNVSCAAEIGPPVVCHLVPIVFRHHYFNRMKTADWCTLDRNWCLTLTHIQRGVKFELCHEWMAVARQRRQRIVLHKQCPDHILGIQAFCYVEPITFINISTVSHSSHKEVGKSKSTVAHFPTLEVGGVQTMRRGVLAIFHVGEVGDAFLRGRRYSLRKFVWRAYFFY